jgi:5-methylcytosine-specific restriction endonuclease McrA
LGQCGTVPKPPCSVDDCDGPVLARGLCRVHYDSWYARTHRAEAHAAKRKWRLENPDKMAAARAKWEAEHPERRREYRRARKRLDPVSNRGYVAARKARKRAATLVPFTPDQLRQRLAFYGGCCWICGATATTIDHVKPLSKGGAHMLCNLRPACGTCNTKKGTRWPYEPESAFESELHN